MSGLRLENGDFNAWVKRFELYVNLTLLGNDGYFLVRDLCILKKPSELSYDDLKQSLSDYINPKTKFNNRMLKIYKTLTGS